jgi:hypothetical protein
LPPPPPPPCNPGPMPAPIPACASCTSFAGPPITQHCFPIFSGSGFGVDYFLSGDGCSWLPFNYFIPDCANP